MSRIQLKDTGMEVLLKMSGGNPGAVTVLTEIINKSAKIDPNAILGDIAHILSLDGLEIYEDRIWMLYKDVCNGNIASLIALLRAVHLGILNKSALNHAINNYGDGVNVKQIHLEVCEQLPDFQKPDTIEVK